MHTKIVPLKSGHHYSAVKPICLVVKMCHEVQPVLPISTFYTEVQAARAHLAVAIHAFEAAKERAEALCETINAYRGMFTEVRLSRERTAAEAEGGGGGGGDDEESPSSPLVDGQLAELVYSTMANCTEATHEVSLAAAGCVEAAQVWRDLALAQLRQLQQQQQERNPETQIVLLEEQVNEAEEAVQHWLHQVTVFEESAAGQKSILLFWVQYFSQFN